MKNIAFILMLVAVTLFIGCSKASSSTHLTEAQVIALAKPVLPLPAGESYHAHFKDGIWEVYTEPDGKKVESWTVVKIQDADGKILGTEIRL